MKYTTKSKAKTNLSIMEAIKYFSACDFFVFASLLFSLWTLFSVVSCVVTSCGSSINKPLPKRPFDKNLHGVKSHFGGAALRFATRDFINVNSMRTAIDRPNESRKNETGKKQIFDAHASKS